MNEYRQKLMNYFEKMLGDTIERKEDRFIIKAKPKKIEYKPRLPLIPEEIPIVKTIK